MARSKFINGSTETHVTATRVGVWFMVDFDIPDDIRDRLPVDAIGTLEMMFYCDPHVGQTIIHFDHEWEVSGVIHFPTRRNSRNEKRIPIVKTNYLGSAVNNN